MNLKQQNHLSIRIKLPDSLYSLAYNSVCSAIYNTVYYTIYYNVDANIRAPVFDYIYMPVTKVVRDSIKYNVKDYFLNNEK